MDLQLTTALLVSKTIAFVLNLAGSGATAAPGLYALKIDPNLVKKLTKNFKNGSIIISGTNGKTTTSRLASEMLSSKYKVIHNRQGSNLLRGIASTLIKKASVAGKADADLGLWEIDEAALPIAIDNLTPKTVVLLNLFRDQLDRYGEIDTLRSKWQTALSQLSKNTTLILNSDDPGISILAKNFKGKIIYFGVNDKKINLPQVANIADIKHCPNCGQKLSYQAIFSSHLGIYHCPNCKFIRPSPQILASNLKFKADFTTSAQFSILNSQFSISYNLPGLYNVYNILAAASVGSNYGIKTNIIKDKIQKFSTAFGRFQSVQIPASPAGGGNKSALIFLIKNPTGANEVLRVLSLQKRINLLVILNDKIADGRDVSWIWDTSWEILKNKIGNLSIAGIRTPDMALRLKYAGFKLSKKSIYMGNHIPHKYRNKEINYSMIDSITKLSTNDTLIILPTYTAMLEVQRTLHKLGANQKWHEQ